MRSATRNGRWTAVLLAAGLALAGCGGDDDSGGDGGDGGDVSKADYIEAADALCRAAVDEADAALEEADDLEEFAAVVVPAYRELLEDLRALEMPDGDEDTLEAFHDEVERVLDQVEESPDLLAGTVDPFAEANEAALEYGFEVCGGEGEATDDTGDTGDTTEDTGDTGDAAKVDYIAAADSICIAYSDEINALPEPATDAEFEQSALQAVDLTRRELDELRALDMPEGDEDAITAIYDAVDEALDQIEADPMVLRGTVDPLAEASQMAADYGFQVCGQG